MTRDFWLGFAAGVSVMALFIALLVAAEEVS